MQLCSVLQAPRLEVEEEHRLVVWVLLVPRHLVEEALVLVEVLRARGLTFVNSSQGLNRRC